MKTWYIEISDRKELVEINGGEEPYWTLKETLASVFFIVLITLVLIFCNL